MKNFRTEINLRSQHPYHSRLHSCLRRVYKIKLKKGKEGKKKNIYFLQWNARSLVANGQELKRFIFELETKPEIICIVETWLKPHLNFVLNGYVCERRDSSGGGCATFIKVGVPYRVLGKGEGLEYLVTEVWCNNGSLKVVHFYNPCKRLDIDALELVEGQEGGKIIWLGDFNAHSSLWGGDKTDHNGLVLEELMDRKGLVCLNDGSPTRVGMRVPSVLDLTLVSQSLAGQIIWEVCSESTIGSDHYPIMCRMGSRSCNVTQCFSERWNFNKADWTLFTFISDRNMSQVEVIDDVDELTENVSIAMVEAAKASIAEWRPGSKKRKLVPWWTDECTQAISSRNKAFKVFKNSLSFQKYLEYKREQA